MQPTLAVLLQLQQAHLMNIPFENLNVYYGINVDLGKLFDKIILNQRGGFCYELNWPFHELLLALGFDAKVASARVYDHKNGYGKEFDHMVIIVRIDGEEEVKQLLLDVFKIRISSEYPIGVLNLN